METRRYIKMGAAEAKAAILANKTALGIEFGSTRIKAILVDDKNQPIASGAHEKMVSGHTVWMISGQVFRTAIRTWQKM
jgi:activator of 2-hydroxyglutaryl-CoA dehydratase